MVSHLRSSAQQADVDSGVDPWAPGLWVRPRLNLYYRGALSTQAGAWDSDMGLSQPDCRVSHQGSRNHPVQALSQLRSPTEAAHTVALQGQGPGSRGGINPPAHRRGPAGLGANNAGATVGCELAHCTRSSPPVPTSMPPWLVLSESWPCHGALGWKGSGLQGVQGPFGGGRMAGEGGTWAPGRPCTLYPLGQYCVEEATVPWLKVTKPADGSEPGRRQLPQGPECCPWWDLPSPVP